MEPAARSRTRRPAAALALTVALVVSAAPSTLHGRQHDPGTTVAAGGRDDAEALPPVLPSDDAFRSHPDLTAVAVEGAAHERARAAYDTVALQLARAHDDRGRASLELAELHAARGDAEALLRAASARRAAFGATVARLDAALADLAAEVFMRPDASGLVAALLEPERSNDRARDLALAEAALDSLLAERDAARTNLARAASTVELAADELASVNEAIAAAERLRDEGIITSVALGPDLARARDGLEDARAVSRVRGTDFTLVALDAYHRAATSWASVDPGCGLEWWALAGISRVEGRHGTYGGARLGPDGSTRPFIIGIALDGTNDTAVIADSDGGAIDGDPAIDRAVGPMQFIPDTWRRFAADGNLDGEASPHNLYDAALAAARYLCRSGRGLTGDGALRVAYFSYNRSEAYVEQVLAHARAYQTAVEVGDDG